MKDDELLDLVNKDDEVIGTINRMDYKRLMEEKLGYIRAIDLFIMNSQGQLYVPVRTADKTIAPNGFDYSVGGHVGAGDDYIATAIREAEEELNLTITENDLEFIAKTATADVRYIREFYLIRSDDEPNFNPDDFVSASWMHPEELLKQIRNGHPAKSNIPYTVMMLQNYLG